MKKTLSIVITIMILMSICGCSDKQLKSEYPHIDKTINLDFKPNSTISFYASDNGYFYKGTEQDDKYELFYIKGVNIGLTQAKTSAEYCEISYDTFVEWFDMISDMGANTVRVFTAMNPEFYRALYDYNISNPKKQIFFIQGIWFPENMMYSYNDAFDEDMMIINAFEKSSKEIVDIVHGSSNYTRYGHYYPAIYDKDVSKYLVGYILGLEYPSEFVSNTNENHRNESNYDGEYLKTTDNSTAFESFLCRIGDNLIKYETEHFECQTPISFLNWQPLDVLSHSSEPYHDECDSVQINTENIVGKSEYFPGLFAAFDVYPYYPEFMNHQKEYVEADDNFKAYLEDLKKQYSVPLLIAEYGVPSSRNMAHSGINGYNQGYLTEDEQGALNALMTDSIARSGCCGGLLFEWQDEWFKRTWNVVNYYSEDSVRTHNMASAEQSYGLLSYYYSEIYPDGDTSEWNEEMGIGESRICVKYDSDYMNMLITLPDNFDFENDVYYIPISITEQGSSYINNTDITFSTPVDYILIINGKSNTRILCDAYNDVFYYKYAVLRGVFENDKKVMFSKNSGLYNKIYTYISNEMYLPDEDLTIEPQYIETGIMKYGDANPTHEDFDSLADFCLCGNKIEIRIPYYLIGIMNAKTADCIAPLTGDEIEFQKFYHIYVGSGVGGNITLYDTGFKPTINDNLKCRMKKSYSYVKEAFEKIELSDNK